MKFAYKFSNLLGTIYRKGNLLFSPSGDTVISLVGNRISFYDLKNDKSECLPIESRFNFDCIALSPNGCIFIAVNEVGEALLCSLISRTVIHHHYFRGQVKAIKFSPDGRRFAVAKGDYVFVYKSPGTFSRQYNPFSLERVFRGSFDETNCLDWSSDSRVLAVGSKDMCTKVYAVDRMSNFRVCTLGSHNDSIIGCFFEKDSLDLITISRNCQLCVWESNLDLDGLELWVNKDRNMGENFQAAETPDAEKKIIKETETEDKIQDKLTKDIEKVSYSKSQKYFLRNALKGSGEAVYCTSACYHQSTKILVTGFSHGAFLLHEMPELNLIHSLSLSENSIDAISMNSTGDWIALASANLGQLIVWEWQSESFVLKQQGHFNNMNCVAYSPDGQFIVTGGDDGKVKLWNTNSGFCFATFSEHKGGISSVCFTQSGKAILSASLDGTIRAYDIKKYRNFKTFTSFPASQFSCMAVDTNGSIVCAGSSDTFKVFVWSMVNGSLMDVLTGHEAPVSGISFSPSQALLLTSSWDKTVRLWDVFENKGGNEAINTITDALAVVFRPDGLQFAVSTLDGQISFFLADIANSQQLNSIDGRKDLGLSAKDTDLVTSRKLQFGRAFNTLSYTADGTCILAAGSTKFVCIYNVSQTILLKKFEISSNLSLDGVNEMINRRKMTEFGNIALVEDRDDIDSIKINLPGVKKGDMASRSYKPEIKISCLQFSPTGREFAAATTEGLHIYSLDHRLTFDPFELDENVTVANVNKALELKNYLQSLMLALRLNEHPGIIKVVESIPVSEVDFVGQSLTEKYIEKLLNFLGNGIESSVHIEFYLRWIQTVFRYHGQKLKSKSVKLMPTLRLLQKNISTKFEDISKICEHNQYLMEYLVSVAKVKHNKKVQENDVKDDALLNDHDDMEIDDEDNGEVDSS